MARGARTATPPAVVALLCAGAFAEFGSGLGEAGLGVLANVGANTLTDVIKNALERVRGRPETSFEDELAEQLEARLTAGDAALSADIAKLLEQVDAGSLVLEAMRAENHDGLAHALQLMTEHFGELRFLLGSVLDGFDRLIGEQASQGALLRAGSQTAQQQLAELTLIRDMIARLPQSDRAPSRRPGRPSPGRSGCPYRGLEPFRISDADIFYGREQLTHDLLAEVAARSAGGGVLVVSGVSGAGKSSLLRAGLLPALTRGAIDGSARWPQLVLTPGGDALTELATHLAALGGRDAAEVRRQLADRPHDSALTVRQAVLAAARHRHADGRARARLVLVVDQFEELFTHADDDGGSALVERERRAFITALHAMSSSAGPSEQPPPAVVVAAVRGDFTDRLAAYPELAAALGNGLFVVGAMSEPELRRAIIGPAHAAGLEIEPGLTETILADLRPAGHGRRYEAAALPLLSQALRNTYHESDKRHLTLRDYGRSGSVTGAVSHSAEHVYRQLTPAQRQIARKVFTRLVALSAPGGPARRTVPRAQLAHLAPGDPAAVDDVLVAFAAQRLIALSKTTSRPAAEDETGPDMREGHREPQVRVEPDSAEISHEVVLTAWPRLRDWLDPYLDAKILLDQLDKDADDWSTHPPGAGKQALLYRGPRLSALLQLQQRAQEEPDTFPTPHATGQAFLAASTAQATRATRLRRAALTALSTLLILAIAAATVAVRAQRTADLQRDAAVSRHLAERSQSLAADHTLTSDPALPALLAAAAGTISPTTPEAQAGMLNILRHPYRGSLAVRADDVAFSPDGRILASACYDGTVRLWDTVTRAPIGDPIKAHTGRVQSVAFSPDGRILASAGVDDGIVRLWDTVTRAPIGDPVKAHTRVWSVSFSPDGRTLASAGVDDGVVRLWDTATQAAIGDPIKIHTKAWPVSFSPDGRTLATAYGDGIVRLWDTVTRAPIGDPIKAHTKSVSSMAFSADGRTLATADGDSTIRLWDPTTQAPIGFPMKDATLWVWSVAFSPDGRILAYAGADGTVQLWDTTTHAPIGAPIKGHTGMVSSMAFSPDGRTLVTAGYSGIWLWDTTIRAAVGDLEKAHIGSVRSVAFSADGRTLATAGGDGTVRLWNATTRAPISDPIKTHTRTGQSVAVSPDGRILATTGDDSTVRLWDTATRAPIGDLVKADTKGGTLMAFSPDGRLLAIAGDDSTVRLWDTATRAPIGGPVKTHAKSVTLMAFSPDGRILATTGHTTVQLWDTATRAAIGDPIKAHIATVRSLAFSPDGRTLATADGDGIVRLWDTATRAGVGDPIKAHTGSVWSMAFSPDGRTLATAGDDNTARLWDTATRVSIGAPIKTHAKSVQSVVFSPDGRTLATAGDDNTVQLWDVRFPDASHLLAAVCGVAARSLTRDQWATYIPELSFRPVCHK
ncbi:AAA family ATPase [Nonomuraea sp. NPDC049758]|uniref:nSTAND1 domain-containing NTPase n=1 Tax=Nonomuraea sp. NPDC049758 TaxID=3154360 RepID=UPI003423855E